MIEKKKKIQYIHIKREIIAELGEDNSAEALLDNLLGNRGHWVNSDYRIFKYEDVQKRSIWNRLNYIWVWPLFILSIPFSWVLTGTWGLTRDSKIGKVVDWLVKFDS